MSYNIPTDHHSSGNAAGSDCDLIDARFEISNLREERRKLRKVLREMLDCYWGEGDGDEAPEFIQRAAKLSGWRAPMYSLKGEVYSLKGDPK